jgi:hypothetical protein
MGECVPQATADKIVMIAYVFGIVLGWLAGRVRDRDRGV